MGIGNAWMAGGRGCVARKGAVRTALESDDIIVAEGSRADGILRNA